MQPVPVTDNKGPHKSLPLSAIHGIDSMSILVFQSAFNSGELSPRLYGQINLSKYANGLEHCENFICLPQGPAARRNGTVYVAPTKIANRTTRLAPFIVASNSYILEFGHLYLRFYTNSGQVTSGGVPVEITTTYTESELADLQWSQFGTDLYIVHSNHPPAKLSLVGAGFTLSTLSLSPPPSYEAGYEPRTTITPGATSGTAVTFTAGTGTFNSGDIGRQIVNLVGTGKASITAVSATSGATSCTATIVENFPSTSAIPPASWKLDLSPICDLGLSTTTLGSICTVTSFSPGTTTTYNSFRSTDVGSLILVNGGVLQITQFTDAAHVNAVILKSLNNKTNS